MFKQKLSSNSGSGEFEVIAGVIIISIIWMVGSCSLDWFKEYKKSRVGVYRHQQKGDGSDRETYHYGDEGEGYQMVQ